MDRARRWLQQGLSLVETVVTLGVLAATLQLAAPALGDMLQNAALTAASQDLLMDLHLARSEALKRNRRVAICKSFNGVQCASAGGWEQGWIVFHDENNSGTIDPGEEVIARHEPLKSMLRARGNQSVANYVSYSPIGTTRLTTGAFQAGTLTICRRSALATPAREVIVNSVGRPRLQKATVASCDP
jgi:type IV fimbrial biogenesis protein FimT